MTSMDVESGGERLHTFLIEGIAPVIIYSYKCAASRTSAAAGTWELGVAVTVQGDIPHQALRMWSRLKYNPILRGGH